MTYIKLKQLIILSIILLVSSIFIGGASAATQNGAITPLANSMPFPFATPTPVPTITPVPTPKPEPTAKPTLEINCRTTALTSNLKVEVTGSLTYNEEAINATTVYIAYSADYGQSWENFSLVQTHPDGSYSASWIPKAIGNYVFRAQYMGNDSLHWMNATVNLALAPDPQGNVFSVSSKSSISDFTYNSGTRQIAFETNETSETTGYAYICIPKSLVNDAQSLQVSIDDKSATFDSESQEDVWVISCMYSQSEHAFIVQLPSLEMHSRAQTQTPPWIAIIVAIAVIVVVAILAVTVRRRRKTAATVAAILKENRPKY